MIEERKYNDLQDQNLLAELETVEHEHIVANQLNSGKFKLVVSERIVDFLGKANKVIKQLVAEKRILNDQLLEVQDYFDSKVVKLKEENSQLQEEVENLKRALEKANNPIQYILSADPIVNPTQQTKSSYCLYPSWNDNTTFKEE